MTRLNVKALGLAFGIAWAGGLFLLGLCSMIWGWGLKWVELIGAFYVGYQATLPGSVIGAVWGFFDAGIFGVLVAWLYNVFAR